MNQKRSYGAALAYTSHYTSHDDGERPTLHPNTRTADASATGRRVGERVKIAQNPPSHSYLFSKKVATRASERP